ncbi:MAG: UDP-N-acetylmuramoyl-tripeptide--D-alanyl-D-alanine ligase [Chloroflexota bacterium]
MADLLLVISMPWALAFLFQVWHLLLFFQIEEYDSHRFIGWMRDKITQIFSRAVVITWLFLLVFCLIIASLRFTSSVWLVWLAGIAGGIIAISIGRQVHRPQAIKKLKYTQRLQRLLLGISAFSLIVMALSVRVMMTLTQMATREDLWSISGVVLLWGMWLFTSPIWLIAVNSVLFRTLEKIVQESYLWSATSKIKRFKPIIVGITGSFGKTSTKEILAHIVATHKQVLATPQSYNTLMGVCKVINASLRPEHKLFIVEMGAYQIGEIARICQLTPPHMGTITAVGPQHLERFGSLESIAQAKYELIKSIPPKGTAVFNADDEYTPRFVQQIGDKEVILVSIQNNPSAQLWATEIRTTPKGMSFTIIDRRSNEMCSCAVKLLGKHNVLNILIATALGLKLGLNLRAIGERLKSLKPVHARLQLLPQPNGINLINDAYNSNPVGARYALEILGGFESGKKILVTPGMVELGVIEKEENHNLGLQAAGLCDFVILVGVERTAPIYEGLREAKFDLDKVVVVSTFQKARETFLRLAQQGDTVLLLNDLPDIYSEKI